MRRDLFSADGTAGFLSNGELLTRLATERLMDAAHRLQADEGWAWVEARTRRDYGELATFDRVHKQRRKLTRDEQRTLDRLTKAYDEAQTALDSAYMQEEDDDDDDTGDDDNALEQAVSDAENAVTAFVASIETWDAETVAQAGAFVMLDPGGEVVIERGLLRRTHREGRQGHDTAQDGSDMSVTPAKMRATHSEPLCRRLTAHRTAIAQAELMKRPDLAVALVLAKLIPVGFCRNKEGGRQVPAK
uniref:hypothetical protein n=1 Tax=Burkholderia arboris TaxID=488730 RepID=UPI003BEEBCF7